MTKAELIQRFINGEEGRNHNAMCYSISQPHCTHRHLILHETEIVREGGGLLLLNHGGWKTNTTKSYMNMALDALGLPFGVSQQNFEWYLLTPNGQIPFDDVEHIDLSTMQPVTHNLALT